MSSEKYVSLLVLYAILKKVEGSYKDKVKQESRRWYLTNFRAEWNIVQFDHFSA